MRYWFVLLLAACTASNWTKGGATTADLDRDYDEYRDIDKLDTATATVAGRRAMFDLALNKCS